jgi:putative tryptophan/tyrosine transport system substrate-binding protein
MAIGIARRQFISALGAAIAWPLTARAQQSMPVVGFIHSGSPGNYMTDITSAFIEGLKENGFVEGRDVTIEYRYAEGDNDRLPSLVGDLIGRHVAVLMAGGGPAPARVAMDATSTIPIVFLTASDPVAMGLVASINRPGGNVTGVSMIGSALESKRLELLHELAPQASTIAILINPNYPGAKFQAQEVQQAAVHLGVKPVILNAGSEHEIDAALAAVVQQGVGAFLVAQDPFIISQSEKIVTFAASHALPSVYSQREFVDAGGLAGYGPNFAEGFRQAGIYVAKILEGEKPADLPVVQPTKFELVINLKTAKALGVNVPQTLLVAADEVIE